MGTGNEIRYKYKNMHTEEDGTRYHAVRYLHSLTLRLTRRTIKTITHQKDISFIRTV